MGSVWILSLEVVFEITCVLLLFTWIRCLDPVCLDAVCLGAVCVGSICLDAGCLDGG